MFIPIEFQKAFQKTEQTAIAITARYDDQPAALTSRFGGNPYWQKGVELPRDKTGKVMALLAQINCSELPENPYFPKKGLLQCFIPSNDEYYGANLDTFGGKSQLFTHFWENPDADKAIAWPTDSEETDLIPAFGAHTLTFSEKKAVAGIETIECAEALNANPFEVLEDVSLNEKEEQRFYDTMVEFVAAEGHKLLGYPDFVNGDPRANSDYCLLLQMDTDCEGDNDIMWGDNGRGYLFIRKADLQAGRCDKLVLYWDC